jgi:hypothetical protein
MLRFWVWLHELSGRMVDRLSPIPTYDWGQMTSAEWDQYRAKTERDWRMAQDAYWRGRGVR